MPVLLALLLAEPNQAPIRLHTVSKAYESVESYCAGIKQSATDPYDLNVDSRDAVACEAQPNSIASANMVDGTQLLVVRSQGTVSRECVHFAVKTSKQWLVSGEIDCVGVIGDGYVKEKIAFDGFAVSASPFAIRWTEWRSQVIDNGHQPLATEHTTRMWAMICERQEALRCSDPLPAGFVSQDGVVHRFSLKLAAATVSIIGSDADREGYEKLLGADDTNFGKHALR